MAQSKKQASHFARKSRLPFLVLLVLISMLSGLTGAATAVMLTYLPFQHFSKTAKSSPVSTFIPGVLTRPINILVLGIDNSGHPHTDHAAFQEALSGNSDTMLLIRIEPESHRVNILSIPRDTLVQLSNIGIDKINDANVRGGAALAETTVSQLLNGLPIDRYIRLDTEGFTHLIDAIGDLAINIPKPMNYEDHTQHLSIHFEPGLQKLSGQHLQEYVRYRHDEMGDIGRVKRQQVVLKALLQKLMQPSTLTKLPQIFRVARQNVDTDLSLGEMLAIEQSVSTVDRHQVNVVMLPGRFSREDEYTLSYWISDPEATTPILSQYFAN